MKDEFIQVLNQYNLTTWYMLPLISKCKDEFGAANFMQTYLSTDLNYILVQVADANLLSRTVYTCEFYCESFEYYSTDMLVYRMDANFSEDVKRFAAGQYSQFSAAAKALIRKYSGLKYNVPDTKGNLITDAVLMALDKHPALIRKWEEVLTGYKPYVLPEGIELLSKPAAGCFIDISTFKGYTEISDIEPITQNSLVFAST